MKLARFRDETGSINTAIESGGQWLPLPADLAWSTTLELSLKNDAEVILQKLANQAGGVTCGSTIAATIASPTAPVWGAGLNYRGHSEDLQAAQPAFGPGSYLRPANSFLDSDGVIVVPTQSKRVTAEAELGLVFGRHAKNVRADDWRSVIVGFTAVLDMTAEDAIRMNPRYIPWAKGFDAFCSIGPQLVTLGDFPGDSIREIEVSTVRNGVVESSARTSAMKYGIGDLVEYFSAGRTLVPGTIICTGTPGATVISSGDRIESIVSGIGHLSHDVC